MTAVMDPDDVRRAVRRIAHEIIEQTDDAATLAVLGIPSRGVELAQRLGDVLAELGAVVPVGVLDTRPFRDDLVDDGPPPIDCTDVTFAVEGRTVILVDDVLHTGRTVRAALDALVSIGRPARVRVAALVDRGHRELPIRADYVGKNLPTSAHQRVSVRLQDRDGEEGVWLEAAADAVTGGAR